MLTDVKTTVMMNAAELTRETQYEAPVDTGTLERSVNMDIEDGGLTAVVEPTAEYAGFVEFGTRYMGAQPFLGPAFKKQSNKFKKDMKRLVE